MGENGSGKTTLAKILAGLYDPEAGTVRWDDVDAAQMSTPSSCGGGSRSSPRTTPAGR